MFVASWFRSSKRALTAVLSKSACRKPPRRPAHSPPSLECLEERVVPDGASGNLGIVDNGAINFQGGITLVPNPPSGQLSGIAIGVFTSPLNASGALDLSQLGFGLPFNTPNFTQFALGFGSGTQPNQPWVPNAYNLGLANHQWAYPSMADLGFQAPPPWTRQIAHFREKSADTDLDEQDAPPRTFLAIHQRTKDSNSIDQISVVDEDAAAASEEPSESDSSLEARAIPLIPHSATQTEDAEVMASRATLSSQEADDLDVIPQAARTSWEEEAAFQRILTARRVNDPEALDAGNGDARTHVALVTEEDPFVMGEGEEVIPVLRHLNLSSTLVLSILTPAQFMALLVEPPESAVPRNDCEEEELSSETE